MAPATTDPVSPLPHRYLDAMANSLDAILAEQLENGQMKSLPIYVPFHPADQKVVYPLAYLWACDDTHNAHRGSPRVLDAALRLGDFLAQTVDDKGVLHYDSNGYRVRSVTQWLMHAWLEAWMLLERELGPARAAAWRARLEAGAATVLEEIRRWNRLPKFHTRSFDTSPNHASLYAAYAYRAGQLFGHADWLREVDAFMDKFVLLQDADGFWPEYEGPVTAYGFMTLCGVALWADYAGRADIAPRVERSAAWFSRVFHPDGAPMICLDGRMQGHKAVSPFAHFAIARTSEGRALIDLVTRDWPTRRLTTWEFMHAAQNHRYWPAGGSTGRLPLAGAMAYRMNRTACTRREGPWSWALQAIVTPQWPDTPWSLDRQTLIELHHVDAGTVLEGSNCKQRRQAATFGTSRDAQDALPVSSDLDANVSRLDARFGAFAAELAVEPGADGALILSARARDFAAADTVYFRLQPGVHLGTEISLVVEAPQSPTRGKKKLITPEGGCATQATSARQITLGSERFSIEGVRSLSWGKVALDFDAPARVWWPMEGYDSYAADHKYPDLAAARLIVEVSLSAAKPACRVTARIG